MNNWLICLYCKDIIVIGSGYGGDLSWFKSVMSFFRFLVVFNFREYG